ncbi:MAG: cellulase family glycosylhydrolase [Planctomycetota bacterium]
MLALSPAVGAQCNDCWLEVSGKEIVNASTRRPMQLRAVGLGNWLLQEGYMLHPQGCAGCPGTQWQMKAQYLSEGLSTAEVEDFYQSWRDTFITREDIDHIASLGFNSVRLPMHYELFLTDAQRAVRTNVLQNLPVGHDAYKAALRSWLNSGQLFVDPNVEGFRVIDRLIEWCEANGMYVMLDMHAAPGAQGSDLNICDGFYANNLWEFPVFQDTLDRLWKSLSDRYKADPTIAMYEFINEPNNVPGGGPAIRALTQRLLTTIRSNGDHHIVTLHGNGWGNHYDSMLPSDFTPNWGLVYSAHRYWIDPADDWVSGGNPNVINRMIDLIQFRDTHNVPVWVGETGENTAAWLAQNIATMEAAGLGWCHWTYKRHDFQENAALYRLGGNYPTDGAFAMPTVLNSIRFQNQIPNPSTLAAVTGSLPAPGTTGCSFVPDGCVPFGETVLLRGVNGGHVSSEGGQGPMTCTVPTPGTPELFTVVNAGLGQVALRDSAGRYVSSENGVAPMTCNRLTVGSWERFDWLDLGNGRVALRGNNGRFVSSENGLMPMRCDREVPDAWESFEVGSVNVCAASSVQPGVLSGLTVDDAESKFFEIELQASELGLFALELDPQQGAVGMSLWDVSGDCGDAAFLGSSHGTASYQEIEYLNAAPGAAQLVIELIYEAGDGGSSVCDLSFGTRFPGEVGELICLGEANSTGTFARTYGTGSASVVSNSLTLSTQNLPLHSVGFYNASMGFHVVENPAGSLGDLCIAGGPIGRFLAPGQLQNSGAMGSVSLTIDLTQLPQPQASITGVPGDTWYFQFWHRDSLGGIPFSHFSSALRVRLL